MFGANLSRLLGCLRRNVRKVNGSYRCCLVFLVFFVADTGLS